MASLTWWTWVWVDPGSWWWTGRPGVLRFMGSQRVRHNWATELNWIVLEESILSKWLYWSRQFAHLMQCLLNYQWHFFTELELKIFKFVWRHAKWLQSCLTVRPHRWQPTRLPRPWDSPGKNTGVGCHFLLQCMKVKSESEVAQSCPTPSNPMDCSPPGFSIHGIFQARVLEWVAIAFFRSPLRVYKYAIHIYIRL